MVRRRLVAADAAELRTHDHTAWCGRGPQELHEVAVAVFRNAIARHERMVFLSEQPHREWLAGLGDVDQLIDDGSLLLLRLDDVYAHPAGPAEQRADFEVVLEQALADGYTGLCVVADNTRFATDSDEQFHAWLEWEAMADHMQSSKPISGVCYFDGDQLSSDRLTDLAAMHPVRSSTMAGTSFQIYCDSDQLHAVGEMDGFDADRIRRVVGSAVTSTRLALDITELDFIDHTTLRVLNDVAAAGPVVRVHGATPLVHRLWDLLDLPAPALELC